VTAATSAPRHANVVSGAAGKRAIVVAARSTGPWSGLKRRTSRLYRTN